MQERDSRYLAEPKEKIPPEGISNLVRNWDEAAWIYNPSGKKLIDLVRGRDILVLSLTNEAVALSFSVRKPFLGLWTPKGWQIQVDLKKEREQTIPQFKISQGDFEEFEPLITFGKLWLFDKEEIRPVEDRESLELSGVMAIFPVVPNRKYNREGGVLLAPAKKLLIPQNVKKVEGFLK